MDRDMDAGDEYVKGLDGAGRIPDLCGRARDRETLRAMLREAFVQGWHAAMVARDQDDANGVCQECGGTSEEHKPMCSQR